ncbi:MAG: pseudouridine-5'-phosphate glycosidase [Chloroflexi bacterium]|nr:pseudouridine-5'-phosphate glycosidase [Chloroflexota bacterium]
MAAGQFRISPGVALALQAEHPTVVLESTVISHGLPFPDNYDIARQCETAIRDEGVVPATVGVINGVLRVGLTDAEIHLLATHEGVRKVSRRDLGIVLARGEHGGTTVAATMIAAHKAGIAVFTTGGIGGVHRGDAGDVSADLQELGRTPVVVVCAGAKSILDLPRTLEYLETMGVPVLGLRTDTFPAFYASSSGLPVDQRVESVDEAAAVIQAHWRLGLRTGVVLAVPPPVELALAPEALETAVRSAVDAAEQEGISGKALTPFLLERISVLTEGRSKAVNLALLEQNARTAARLAVVLAQKDEP